MARKISGRRSSKKQSAPVKYDCCGCCPEGLVVYTESIEDVLDTDCHYAFRENFKMFLRKQNDKNTETDMDFEMKHEQRMSFADDIGLGARCFECEGAYENDVKRGSYRLAMAGRRFISRPDLSNYNWPDDMLEGFDKADVFITHLKDLHKSFGHKKMDDLSNDDVKAIKKDLVVSGYRWVVEQLDAALEEFKEFRDGLGENEREKWDKSVIQQSEKLSDFEMERFESYEEECERFEVVDALIKDLHKGMDDIIARYNNRNKDIDSLVELIEGKSLGAVPKKKKENISRSHKKKNPEKKRKDAEDESEGNINSQQLKEKMEQFKFDTSSLIALDTKFKLLEVENHVQVEEEVSQNANSVPMINESPNVGISEMQRLMTTEVEEADVKKMEEEPQLTNSRERLVFTDEHEKCQNVKEPKKVTIQESGDKVESTQKEPGTNHVFSSNVENREHQIDEVRKDDDVNGQILINEVKKEKKRDKASKPNCARDSCTNKGRHKCSRCKAVFYCAQDCLNEDWPHHKMFCDYVFKANQVPGDSTSKKSSENNGGREEVD